MRIIYKLTYHTAEVRQQTLMFFTPLYLFPNLIITSFFLRTPIALLTQESYNPITTSEWDKKPLMFA